MQKQKPLEAFKASGQKPGLEVWVVRAVKPRKKSIPNLFHQQHNPETEYELITVPPAKHGVFYFEDLYVVIKTTEQKDRNVHFWIGKSYNDTPPPWLDKFEDLDVGWTADQHFEFQGLECQLFESYFEGIQPAIRYKRGRHPDPYAERARGETRFYKLERLDEAHYRVREIPFNIALMTKEECFILDTDYNTRTYVSDRTTADERNKSIIVANRIRELDHEGNGAIEVVELTTFSNDADKQAYVKAAKLDEQDIEAPVTIDYDTPDDDPTCPQVQLNMITLLSSEDADIGYPPRFRYVPKPKKIIKEEKKGLFTRIKKNILNGIQSLIGQDTKKVIEYEIPTLDDKFVKSPVEKPYKASDLSPKKCYLLQGAAGQGVMMWVGSSCDETCKSELTECLRLEIKRCEPTNENNDNEFELEAADNEAYHKKDEALSPQWNHAIKVTEGHEPLKFKRYFHDWA